MASAPTAAALDEEKRQRFHEQSGSRELPSVLPKDAHLEGGHVVANDKGSDSDIITEERAAKAGSIETRPTWTFSGFYKRYNVFFDIFFVAVILGWWISGLIIRPSYWIITTIWSWFFIGLFFFKYVPSSTFGRPIGRAWQAGLARPFFRLSYYTRLAIGWLFLLGLIFGSAYGFPPAVAGSSLKQRTQAVFGLFVAQLSLWLFSKHRTSVKWQPVLGGLALQQILGMFVLKTSAGYDLFRWVATAAQDLLGQSAAGASFFFSADVYDMHYFFVNVLAAIIFFIALVQLLYYIGALQWLIKKFAWFFFRLLGVSGAESVVAAASPFVGQGESACLVKPFVSYMTPAEIHQIMTSGFSTIAGSVFLAYVGLGIPPVLLITSSVLSIPASIAVSKLRYPEMDEPLTSGELKIVKDDEEASNMLHAFSNGAWFGLKIAGLILANVLVVLSLLSLIDGLLTYIGKFWHIERLTLEFLLGYIMYPVAWLIGADGSDIKPIGQIIGVKIIANEFVAFQRLVALRTAGTITERGFQIASYAVCGFGNISSLGIQIGCLSGLAPAQKTVIARVGVSALICGIISTLQTAAIAGMLL